MMRVGGKSDETKAETKQQTGKAGDESRKEECEGGREGGIHKAATSFEDVHHDTTKVVFVMNVFVNVFVMNVNVLLFLFKMLRLSIADPRAFLNHHACASPIHHVPHHGLFRPLLKLVKLVISSWS